jgi:CheY-like chemotaxis protein
MPETIGVNVLLVEDDDVDAEVVDRMFKKLGVQAQLTHVNSSGDGLRVLRDFQRSESGKQCVIFLDLNMPGVDGHGFLAELRKDDRLRKTPVFVLTTSDHSRDIERAYDKNVAGYFTKPRLDELISALNAYIRGAELPAI